MRYSWWHEMNEGSASLLRKQRATPAHNPAATVRMYGVTIDYNPFPSIYGKLTTQVSSSSSNKFTPWL